MSIQDLKNRDLAETNRIPDLEARSNVREALLRLWALIASSSSMSLAAFKQQAQLLELGLRDALDLADCAGKINLLAIQYLDGTYIHRLARSDLARSSLRDQ